MKRAIVSLAVATVSTPGQIDAGAQAGTATITASRPGARSGSVKVTVSTKSCAPVINELLGLLAEIEG